MEKNNQTLTIILVVAFLAFGVWFFTKGEGSKGLGNEGDENENEGGATPPPPPPSDTGGYDGSGINPAPKLYDTESGEGLTAIKAEIRRLMKSKEDLREIRASLGIGHDLLKGTPKLETNNTAVTRFNDHLRTQFNYVDDTDITLTDNPELRRKLEGVISFGNTWEANSKTNRENGRQTMLDLFDFSRIAGVGYSMWANNSEDLKKNFIDSKRVYGDAKNDGDWKRNHLKFRDDAMQIAKNMLAAIDQLENQIPEIAIGRLRSVGWKFYGYDSP